MPSKIPSLQNFEFSQSSLQDFTDCERRFLLRYVQHVAWPAVQAEPIRENERHIQRGERFHRLVQQYLVGIPENRLASMAAADEDPHVLTWWQNFVCNIPPNLAGTRYVETILEDRLSGYRLVAKYDLVQFGANGQVTIYDWKTSPKRPARSRLLERLQSRVYPYLLVRAGAALNGGRGIAPEQVQMIYWFAEPDLPPEPIRYSSARFEQDGCDLLDLMKRITAMGVEDFRSGNTGKSCPYCVYRSLCRRGVAAGKFDSEEAAEAIDDASLDDSIDLEQIGEIRF